MKLSENVKDISAALAAFQGEIKNLPKTSDNPFFKSKYTPLDDILDYARPILSKHGLAVMQFPCGGDGKVGVITLITHASGQWIEGNPCYIKPTKDDAQGAGSAITYARRYTLASVLGIASDDDDDGNSAAGKAPNGSKKAAESYQCVVCGNSVKPDIAIKSLDANGVVYCSGTCKKQA